jgi:hypothetical protein
MPIRMMLAQLYAVPPKRRLPASVTVHPHQRSNRKWVLGRNRAEIDTGDRFGERRLVFDGFWCGDKWAKGKLHALEFASETDALAYLETNYQRR